MTSPPKGTAVANASHSSKAPPSHNESNAISLSTIIDDLDSSLEEALQGTTPAHAGQQQHHDAPAIETLSSRLTFALDVLSYPATYGIANLEEILSPVVFPLFATLSRCLAFQDEDGANAGDVAVRLLAQRCLTVVVGHSSPREILLAAQERLCATDEGGGWGDVFSREITGLMMILSDDLLPRLKTKKPPRILLEPLVDSLLMAMSRAVIGASQSGEAHWASKMVEAVCHFIRVARAWSQESIRASTNKEDIEEPEELQRLLLESVAILSPHLPSPLNTSTSGSMPMAQQMFLQRHRHYQMMPDEAQCKPSSSSFNDATITPDCWATVSHCVTLLRMDLVAMMAARHAESNDRIAVALASPMNAFTLYVKLRLHSPDKPSPNLQDLYETIPLILSALRVGCESVSGAQDSLSDDGDGINPHQIHPVDCALAWLLLILDDNNNDTSSSSPIPYERFLPLTLSISQHAALSPVPPLRHVSLHIFKLLLDRYCPQQDDDDTNTALALEIIKDTISESPFPQLRSATVGVLKDLWIKRDQTPSTSTTHAHERQDSLLSSGAFSNVQSTLFRIPLPLPLPHPQSQRESAQSAGTLTHIDTYATLHFGTFNEVLNLIFVILRRTPLRDKLRLDEHLSAVQRHFVEPLHDFVRTWEEELLVHGHQDNGTDTVHVTMALSLLRLNLTSVQDALG